VSNLGNLRIGRWGSIVARDQEIRTGVVGREFAEIAIPLIRCDSHSAFVDQVYRFAWQVATQPQRALLQSEIERLGIKTEPH